MNFKTTMDWVTTWTVQHGLDGTRRWIKNFSDGFSSLVHGVYYAMVWGQVWSVILALNLSATIVLGTLLTMGGLEWIAPWSQVFYATLALTALSTFVMFVYHRWRLNLAIRVINRGTDRTVDSFNNLALRYQRDLEIHTKKVDRDERLDRIEEALLLLAESQKKMDEETKVSRNKPSSIYSI